MEGSMGGGRRSGSDGLQVPAKMTPAMEELQSRLQETLDVLSPQELRSFRVILKTVDEEPRVSPLQLELEGGSASGLARLLAKHYYLRAAPRVLAKVLEQLRRADLLASWQNAAAAAAEDDGPVIPSKILKRSYDCVEGEMDRYDLSGRRKAFLMCVKRNRPGAHRDIVLMKEWLGQCQFEHTSCIDPDKMNQKSHNFVKQEPVAQEEILRILRATKRKVKELLGKITSFRDGLNEIKDEIGCCLVTLMSHGEKGFIKMKDDERVSLEDIFEMFNNKNCPALQEKPKIFIIQACRGERRDNGVETDDEPMDFDDLSEKRRLPTFSDYFIIYPTQADHVALRHPRTGSVMIEAMIEVFKQHGNKWHIADFFTKVNNRVVHTEFHLREEPIKVSLVMESTLTKSVYF
ncbi:caspase-14-like isoform X1 [Diceros bicornis minor]|uniref:caspase-14-like isoform X1 n=1 Tax=Diceros bicornis minor TaxID=77932 RepID=UPI0026F2D458|nr:caspase-14-like isoform X1 [Diceros bicornis minor]